MSDEDAQYTTATKAVDDRMRTDVLGPNILCILTEHKPVNDQIQAIVAEAIEKHPEARKHLGNFVNDHSTHKKGVWVERIITASVSVAITLLLGYIALHLFGYHAGG